MQLSLRLHRRPRVVRRTGQHLMPAKRAITGLIGLVWTYATQKVREQLMTSGNAAAVEPPVPPTTPVQNTAPSGLTTAEASSRLQEDGANAILDTSSHPLRNALTKFWAPVPWLLEASVAPQMVLHKYLEDVVIVGLLVFDAALAYFQEGRAQSTLTA